MPDRLPALHHVCAQIEFDGRRHRVCRYRARADLVARYFARLVRADGHRLPDGVVQVVWAVRRGHQVTALGLLLRLEPFARRLLPACHTSACYWLGGPLRWSGAGGRSWPLSWRRRVQHLACGSFQFALRKRRSPLEMCRTFGGPPKTSSTQF